MISDTLSDAAADIRDYLSHPATAACYTDPTIRAKIDAVLASMDALRIELDWPLSRKPEPQEKPGWDRVGNSIVGNRDAYRVKS